MASVIRPISDTVRRSFPVRAGSRVRGGHAVAVEASAGDTLVLVFKLGDASLKVIRLGAEDSGRARLHKLLGHAVRKPAAAALAAALNCRKEDVGAVLRRRGENELAAVFDAN